MATHKIDNLFKKKLSKHASVPSEAAWAKMEAVLEQPAKKPVWFFYRIAAAILFLVISGIVFYQNQKGELNQISGFTAEQIGPEEQLYKIEKLIEHFNLHENNNDNRVAENSVGKQTNKVNEQIRKEQQVAQNTIEKRDKVFIEKIQEPIDLIIKEGNLLAFEDDKVNLENKAFKVNNVVLPKQEEKKSLPKIKIIYKRGKKTQPQALLAENDTTSKKKFNFNKIIDATKHITSGDLIADMRDAKDDFLSRGFDFNKSNRVKNKSSNK